MEFALFGHMERSDFSISHKQLFADLEELVMMAEDGGFRCAWIGEHHGMDFTIAPNPFIQLAYLAAKTKRIRLGTGNVVAPFWHPIRLAGEAAMADIATGGRLDLGVARGAYIFEYERMVPGLDAWAAGQRMREMIPALRHLWEGNYAHDGEMWKFPKTTSAPKPLQNPLPIWIAARDPASHDFAVAAGCNVQVTPLAAGDDEIRSLMDRFQVACAAHPERQRPRISLLVHTFVTDSDKETAEYIDALSSFYCMFGSWFKNKRDVDQALMSPLSKEEREEMPHYAPDAIARNLVIGDPETVISRLKSYESLGYDQFSVWIDSGLPHQKKRKSLDLFIRKVLPAFN